MQSPNLARCGKYVVAALGHPGFPLSERCKGMNDALDVAATTHRQGLLKAENLRFAWSDQMSSGVAKGSTYDPRGVTSILWLDE